MRKIILSLSASFLFSLLVFSQNEDSRVQEKTSQVYIESDPTTFFFSGYSLAVRRSSTLIKNLNIGLGLYSAVLPKEFIDQNEDHVGKGWEVKNIGYDMFFDYHIFHENKGLTAGAVMSIYNYDLTRNHKKERITSFVPTIRVGYLWRPLSKKVNGLYVYPPWAGISTDLPFSGNNEIDNEKFEIPKWSFVPSIQIGYSF